MLVFERKRDLTRYLTQQRQAGKTIGLVPTMGALHQGHLSLIEASLSHTDLTVSSIFVNPVQFNNKQDLEKYPRTFEKDQELLKSAGCQVLFCPTEEEIYPEVPQTKFSFGALEEVMEGSFRPGHFQGVALVVSKFFNIVLPDMVFLGQKDLQQCRIIEQLARDLSFRLDIEIVSTVRESDGLAMSSRNARLGAEERSLANAFYRALCLAREKLQSGASVKEVDRAVVLFLEQFPQLRLEYFCIADGGTLQPVAHVFPPKELALCIAGYAGEVRLIDNLLVKI